MTHGLTAYGHGCRCVVCRSAWSAYVIEQRNHPSRVPSDAVRKRIKQLNRSLTYRQIATRAGVSLRTVADIARGNTSLTNRATAEAIFGVTTRWQLPERCMVLNDQLDAFISEAGMTYDAFLSAAGINGKTYKAMRSGESVSEDVADKVARAIGVRTQRLFERVEVAA